MELRKMSSRWSPWNYFFLFLFSNIILSSQSVSLTIKTAVFIFGIVFPVLLSIRNFPESSTPLSPLTDEEFLPPVPAWLWVVLGLTAVFIHFYKLESLYAWPNGDEGSVGLYAIGLTEKWNWKFFYMPDQIPPFLIWVTSFFFRFLKPPLLGLWLFPALVSITVIPLSYLAFRSYFSKSFSFLGVCLTAFSLWLFDCGRWCQPGILLPPWELILFFLMARFLGEKDPAPGKKLAALLGFVLGLGYFTFPCWPFVVLLIGLTFLARVYTKPGKKLGFLLHFSICFSLAFIPFLAAVWKEGYASTRLVVAAFGVGASPFQRVLAALSYFSSLFWGPLKGIRFYSPGNFERLNPVLGAVFFVGLVQMIRYRSHKIVRWVFWASIIVTLPAWLSMYVEMLRIISVLPFLLIVASWGFFGLLKKIPDKRRLVVFLLLLTAGLVLDGFRVFKLHPGSSGSLLELSNPNFSPVSRTIYGVLKEISEKMGTGLIFTEFKPEMGDPTPFVTTYSFNAAENPRLIPGNAHWAAVVTNVHFQRFLSARFPEARWYWLGRGLPQDNETLLGILPVNEDSRETFKRWIQAHHYFRKLTEDLDNINGHPTYVVALNDFIQKPIWISEDRFLESCYWEKIGEFYYQFGFQSHYGDLTNALGQAIEKGYPAAHLYYKLGSLLLRKKNFSGAKKNYEAALRLEPHYPAVLSALEVLKNMEKRGKE